jgi:hypothetical protein
MEGTCDHYKILVLNSSNMRSVVRPKKKRNNFKTCLVNRCCGNVNWNELEIDIDEDLK